VCANSQRRLSVARLKIRTRASDRDDDGRRRARTTTRATRRAEVRAIHALARRALSRRAIESLARATTTRANATLNSNATRRGTTTTATAARGMKRDRASAMNDGKFQVVVAATREGGIGRENALPWRLAGDMGYFKKITSETRDGDAMNAVVMGRKTWESIPGKFRPLPGRLNIVLSRSGGLAEANDENNNGAETLPEGVLVRKSIDDALSAISSSEKRIEKTFVIGGAQIYEEALQSEKCEAVHLTEVEGEFECDAFIPKIDATKFKLYGQSKPMIEKGTRFQFLTYVTADAESGKFRPKADEVLPAGCSIKHEEYQYLEMIREIIDQGAVKGDRTGTGTISTFGNQMRFDLRRSFPLLTTKRVFWRGVAEELLWFVAGETNANKLAEKKINIWDGNGSREYLDSIGLTEREVGDLGPVYGFQWRHFGAEYTNMHADYTGKGVDQLAEVIHKIKNNPNDRRILLTAWNPAALKEMALPPCHMFCQFYVANGELSCQMYQRSCDMGLGVPFNIASYSLLTCMIAQVCGLKPGDFVHCCGDTHVYSNHVEPLEKQLACEPRPFPILKINPEKKDIDSFTFDDFEIVGYDPHPKIEMKMAV
jgi:dihydrofolate reductase/thymidylate synthase